MKQTFRNLPLLSLLAILISYVIPQAVAQDTAAQLSGTVMDASGAAVPHAHLTISNDGTGMTKQTDSDDTGGYVFRGLPPGVYSLSVSADGFTAFVQKGLQLAVEQHATLPVRLKTGGSTETGNFGTIFSA